MPPTKRKPSSVSKTKNNPKVDSDHWFDEKLADLVIDMFESCCTHTEGSSENIGKRLILLPVWRDAIRELVGVKRKVDNMRKFLEAFWCVPRKNSKTHTVAGLALILISPAMGTRDAQGYIFSSTEKQARIMFKMCAKMITQKKFYDDGTRMADEDDILKQNYVVHADFIECTQTGSCLYVLSGTSQGKTGTNPAFFFVDEAHELDNFKAISAIETGIVAQSQPLTIVFTTKGDDIPDAPWMVYYNQADKVRKGDLDARDDLHVVIWEADPTDDPSSPATWAKANPAWGIYLNERVMRALWNKMKDIPERRKEFIKFHCNIATKPSFGYIPDGILEACIQPIKLADYTGRECYGGLDLADSDDMSAFALAFPEWVDSGEGDDDGQRIIDLYIDAFVWYWVPKGAYDRSIDSDYSYEKWRNYIEITDGSIADYGLIRRRIKALQKQFKILQCGFDRYNAVDTVNELGSDTRGREKLEMIQVIQGGLSLNTPTKRLRELCYQKRFKFDGNPVLLWNAQNAMVVEKNKLIHLEKGSAKGKIDGLAAIIDALYLVLQATPKVKSPYVSRGIRTLG